MHLTAAPPPLHKRVIYTVLPFCRRYNIIAPRNGSKRLSTPTIYARGHYSVVAMNENRFEAFFVGHADDFYL